jgi:prevent-host-death family protein
MEMTVKTRTITSTEAQNNFGRVIDSVMQDHVSYIVKRRNISRVIIMSLSDLRQLLANSTDREVMKKVIREVGPDYRLGENLFPSEE